MPGSKGCESYRKENDSLGKGIGGTLLEHSAHCAHVTIADIWPLNHEHIN